MNTSSKLVLASVGYLSLSLARPLAARADHVIDDFSDALVATCGPEPFLWAGVLDSVALSSCTTFQHTPHAVGGTRQTTVREPSATNFVTATTVVEADGRSAISYGTGLGHSGALVLEYGVAAPLSLNLSADRAFQVMINGDMDDSVPVRPVTLTILVRTRTGTTAAASASASLSITSDGAYRMPFTSFTGVDFADVDFIRVTLDATNVSGIDYDLIGGVRTVAN